MSRAPAILLWARRGRLHCADVPILLLLVLLFCDHVPQGALARRLRLKQNPTAALGLKAQFPFYHDSEEIASQLQRLAGTCKGAQLSVHRHEDSGVGIDVVHVRGRSLTANASSSGHAEPTNRVLLLSGEHARELIGPESTLRFLRLLCGDDVVVNSSASVAEVLSSSEFKIVINGNPKSRLLVEGGDYCVRENENAVDLNRNWDEEWNASMTLETARGPSPFSEPETRILRGVAESFKPTTFLSVHSGTLGMYMPWAWSSDRAASRNGESMMQVLKAIDAGHCRCPYGGAGKEVGYPCPGTSVDWIFDKLRTPYSFAFEIWGKPAAMEGLRMRWQEKVESGGAALLQNREHLGHPHFQDFFKAHPSEFVQLQPSGSSAPAFKPEQMSRHECFVTFNPDTEELYEHSVQNWAAAYLETSAAVAKELREKKTVL